MMAGVVAFLFAWALLKAGVRAFVESMPPEFGSLVFDVSPNLAVFVFVFVISLIGGILAGLAPAIESPRSALTSTGRSSAGSRRGRRLQNALVAVQVALSLVLISTGSMFVRGAVNSLGVETGYDSKHLVELGLQFPNTYTSARKLALVNELRTRLGELSGVNGITSARAPGSSSQTAAIPLDSGAAVRSSFFRYTYIQPGYFETLGIPIFLGSGFERQTQNAQFVVLSESAARQMFGAENPLGRRIRVAAIDERPHPQNELMPDGPAYQILGIVRDTRGFEFDGSDSKQIYLPLPNDRLNDRPLLIRTRPNAAAMIAQIEASVASTDPEILVSVSTLEEALRRSPPFLGSALAAAIASGIGMLGLLLALMGIYGTVSQIVAQRTREVGIRIAVGAQKHHVLRLILGESSRPVIAGLAAGMTLAAGVVYLLRGALYGIHANDGIYFVAVSIIFFSVALLASYPPARRAMRVDPVVALRYE
jgi:predicted permease